MNITETGTGPSGPVTPADAEHFCTCKHPWIKHDPLGCRFDRCPCTSPMSWDVHTIALQRARVFLRDLDAWQDNLDHPDRAASMLGRARSILQALVEAS